MRARFQPAGFIGLQAGGEAELDFFGYDRIQYSTLDVGCSMLDVHHYFF
jgi:hypothetical protein